MRESNIYAVIQRYEATFGSDARMFNIRYCNDEKLAQVLLAAIERGCAADFDGLALSRMPEDEKLFTQAAARYHEVFGVALTGPPLDFGFLNVSAEQLCTYAQAAIEAQKPINWRKILGPTLYEQNPCFVS